MKTLVTLLIISSSLATFAQKSDSTRTYYRIIRGTIEHATELKSKKYIRNGEAEIKSGRKVIASGIYKDDKRYGRWRFFDRKDSLEQIYNYTTKKVEYNASTKNLNCVINSLKTGDKLVYPAKIGGFTYAMYYLLDFFKIPSNIRSFRGVHELFYIFHLDDNGRLIKYETRIVSAGNEKIDIINLNRLREEDFEFSPAIVNGRRVASKIIYESKITVD
jgi:hypothetical protein